MKINWLLLIVFVILSNLIGGIGSFWTDSESSWYKSLNKPSFNPPGWIFGVVWPVLFVLMGIAFYFVYLSPQSQLRIIALVLFALQFVLNILWSYLFFGLQNPLVGFVGILVLEVFILATAILFYFVKPVSGFLIIPYFLWVGFASILNYSIFILNG